MTPLVPDIDPNEHRYLRDDESEKEWGWHNLKFWQAMDAKSLFAENKKPSAIDANPLDEPGPAAPVYDWAGRSREELLEKMSEEEGKSWLQGDAMHVTEKDRNNMAEVWKNVGCLPKGSIVGGGLTALGLKAEDLVKAPHNRATILADTHEGRKRQPVCTGVLDYFPDALVAVSEVSYDGSGQHMPGEPMHWDRSKSPDEPDACIRHMMQRGTLDKDGKRHTAKAAWRILAELQKEIENESR